MKKNIPQRPLEEIWDDCLKCSSGKEARKLHEELRAYGHPGMPLFSRYPDFPLYLSVASLVFAIATLFAVS